MSGSERRNSVGWVDPGSHRVRCEVVHQRKVLTPRQDRQLVFQALSNHREDIDLLPPTILKPAVLWSDHLNDCQEHHPEGNTSHKHDRILQVEHQALANTTRKTLDCRRITPNRKPNVLVGGLHPKRRTPRRNSRQEPLRSYPLGLDPLHVRTIRRQLLNPSPIIPIPTLHVLPSVGRLHSRRP